MADWVWPNVPLGTAMFLAMVGIALWPVIKHPHAAAGADVANQMVPARGKAARSAAGPAPASAKRRAGIS